MTTRLAPFLQAPHRQGAPVGQVGWDGISTAPSTAMIALLLHLIFASKALPWPGQTEARVAVDRAGLVRMLRFSLPAVAPRRTQSTPARPDEGARPAAFTPSALLHHAE